jgi:hypothetical protein
MSIYTHNQIKTLFGYIIDDGMSLREASRTTNMTFSAVQAHYRKYTKDPNHNIPLPASELNKHNNACTQDQEKHVDINCFNQNKHGLSHSQKILRTVFGGSKSQNSRSS